MFPPQVMESLQNSVEVKEAEICDLKTAVEEGRGEVERAGQEREVLRTQLEEKAAQIVKVCLFTYNTYITVCSNYDSLYVIAEILQNTVSDLMLIWTHVRLDGGPLSFNFHVRLNCSPKVSDLLKGRVDSEMK